MVESILSKCDIFCLGISRLWNCSDFWGDWGIDLYERRIASSKRLWIVFCSNPQDQSDRDSFIEFFLSLSSSLFLLLCTDWISFLFTTRRKCFLLQDRVFFKYRCPQFLSVYRDFLPIFLSLSLYSTSRNSTLRGKSLYLLLSISFLLFCLPNQFLIYRLSNLFYLHCTKWFFRKETKSEILEWIKYMNCIKNYILLYLYQHFLEKNYIAENIHHLVIVFFLPNMNFLIFAAPPFDKFRKY